MPPGELGNSPHLDSAVHAAVPGHAVSHSPRFPRPWKSRSRGLIPLARWLAVLAAVIVASVVLATSTNRWAGAGTLPGTLPAPCASESYDVDSSGAADRPEAIAAVTDYLLELAGPLGRAPTRGEAIDLVVAYLLESPVACGP